MSETPVAPRPDVGRPLVSIGVALLATTVVLSAVYTRERDHLDRSTFTVGVLAALGLLVVATAAYLRLGRAHATTDLVAWPGAFGSAAVGVLVEVAMDNDAGTYVGGLLALGLAAGGFALTRRAPFVVVVVVAAFLAYVELIDDVLSTDGSDGAIPGVRIALALTLFAVLATAAGWVLPESRVVAGVVAGALTIVGFAALAGLLAINRTLDLAFHVEGNVDRSGVGYADYAGPLPDGPTDDGWTILVLGLVLMLAWAGCAALTGHVAYRLLVVAMAVTVTPLVLRVLVVEHPTWWGVVLAAVGGTTLLVAGARTLRA